MKPSLSKALCGVGAGLLLAGCGDESKTPNIAIGPPASTTQGVSQLLFDAYGIGSDKYNSYQEGFGAALDGVQDGNIDISIGILGLPSGSIENLQASSGDVRLLGLSDAAIDYIESNSAYRRFTIPAGSYDFQDEDVETITAYAVLVGNTHTIDEELGYELARLMHEHAGENTHAQSAFITLENALNGAEGLPIHPGAKRYYEEQGLTVDNPVASLDDISAKSEYVLGTGSQGGTYYPLGGEMATIWNRYLDGQNFTNIETGASIENLVSIRDDRMDLGMTVHAPAQDAIAGRGEFESGAIDNVAFIGHIYPEVIQVVTRESSGIASLDELAD
ncbi:MULTISPECIES: TAXI family TRAP transporter solute-binding subunit [unclassified Halomonas]|uniref:TAXI family TRAP transporter solute-binding subunit n=1 Tax=unclassified Halomonas TaxID=2609666 RepID=UPI0020A1F338|nr:MULTISPECIES: TAXI family TRAP transporter solute-binding subunit [unclassified Halomonas]MCP1315773.1 TAXI family TRAP transporter solute-binding subunit [Halomonas sp. 707D7]MCP1326238.1 TAXI family TRAP transporter solute-binding subunit [Halomonas sp. 707D4]